MATLKEIVACVLEKYGYKAGEVMPEIEKKLYEFDKIHALKLVYHNGELTERAERIFESMRDLLFLESLIRVQKNEEPSERINFLNQFFRSRQNYKVIR